MSQQGQGAGSDLETQDAIAAFAARVTTHYRPGAPPRVIRDEGIVGALRLVKNVQGDAAARRRVLAMRSVLHRYRDSLAAIAMAAKPG